MAESINMFEVASRLKLRFQSAVGRVSAEDLWDIPLVQLDTLAKGLRKELRDTEDSFIEETKSNSNLELSFEIVKYIIEVKLAERAAKYASKEKAARRQVLLEALANKQSETLKTMSVEAIEAELATLG